MFFHGRPLWHCSVALWELDQPLPLTTWLDRHWRVAARMHAVHLASVGDHAEEVRDVGGMAWHLRRVCTPEEITALQRRGDWPRR